MARKSKAKDDRVGSFAVDLDLLRDAVGETVFARGKLYYTEGRVEVVSIGKDRVVATVAGSEPYNAVLFPIDGDVVGECSCPAFETYGFCKHLVATAFAAAALLPADIEASESRAERIRAHLRGKGMDALVEMVFGLALRDPGLMTELAFAADLAGGVDEEALFKEIRTQITHAMRTGGFVEYGAVGGWVGDIDPVLKRIEALIDAEHAAVAIRLLDHFFERMESALGSIDDSDGEGGALCARAQNIHLAACRRARPPPIALARDLFAREVESDWDFFSDAAASYEDVLGESGLAEYRRLAEEAWGSVKPRRLGQAVAADPDFSARYRLGAILDWFAERDGDLDARIAIRGKDLSSPHAYLEVAQLCLDHDRDVQALQWAEDGLWQFEDEPDDRLTVFTANLYRRVGRQADADTLLWRALERSASLALYGCLKAAAGADAAVLATLRDKAISVMRAQLDKGNAGQRRRWQSPADLLVQFAMQENMHSLAWEIVHSHGCREELLNTLAAASEESHPAEALKAHAARVEQLARLGGRTGYEQACRIIERMARVSERVRGQEAHSRWLEGLKLRHKAKRTFMALLKDRNASVSAAADQDSPISAGVAASEVDAMKSRISSGSSRQ